MTRTNRFFGLLLPVVILASFTMGTWAQQQNASLTGRVTDASGAVVPGAQVVVSDPTRGARNVVTTNDQGDYTVPQLAPGEHYQINVTKPGFKETVQRNLVLQVAQAAKVDLTVDVGDVSQNITVDAAPPQLESQSSSLGQVITGQTVENLPLNGRSTFRLIALTPGVTFSQSAYGQFGDVPVNSTWDTNFSINGGRSQSNEILIDGVPSSAGFFDQITTLPIVDETQEFKVQSNNLSAAFGRYSGGAINVTTKSGSNQFHGNAFDFLRNSAFDANEWFNKRNGQARVPFRMNQFGGTIGGPVRLPFYNGRDKTFFFGSYQGTRRLRGGNFTALVPTAAERTGDFSASRAANGTPVMVYNPFTTTTVGATKPRQQFPSNIIPRSLLDPVALKLASYFPLPNVSGQASYNYFSNEPTVIHQDIVGFRVDQNVTQKYHLFGRYAYSQTPLTQPDVFGNVASTGPGAVGTTNFTNQSFAFNNLYVFSPTLLMNVNYGFARWYQARQTRSYGFDNSTLGFPSSLVSAITIPMFPAINIGGGYAGLANQSFLKNGNDSHALLISATKLLGKHTLTIGVDGRLHRINFFNVANSAGSYSFAIAQTQGPNAAQTQLGHGNAFASFLLGAGSAGTFPIGSGVEMQNFYGAVYAQDDIRLTQKLTVNLGVRYDGESPYVDRYNKLNYFDPNAASPAANASFSGLKGGLAFAGTNGVPRSVYTREHGNVVPRVGFAYSPQPTTSVRGGFGMSYAPLEITGNAVGFSPSLGFASSTSWNTSNDGGFTPANLLRNPFPQGFVPPTGSSLGAGTQLGQSVSVWAKDPPTPYAMQWNADVQQQFPSSILLDIGYAGSRGVHLTGTFDRNTLDPSYLSLTTGLTAPVTNPFRPYVSIGTLSNPTVARRQLLLPYPQFLSVSEVNNPYGSSTYHSLQAKLVKRTSHGVTFLVAYTWSKLISNVNGQLAPIGPSDSTGVQNYYDQRAERAVSELDQPHNLVLNAVVELPFGRGKYLLGNLNPVADKFIGGWKLTSILTEQSGFPLTLSAAGVGAGTRPDPVPGVSARISGSRSNMDHVNAWFNPGAFTVPQPYQFGHIGRTYTGVRGPGVQNLDASLGKETRFEWLTAELRAEFFNVTNTPHFAMPDMAVQDPGFGQITGTIASPPSREIQFALKLSF